MLDLKAEDYRGIKMERSIRTTGKKPFFNADWSKCELQHKRKLILLTKL